MARPPSGGFPAAAVSLLTWTRGAGNYVLTSVETDELIRLRSEKKRPPM